MPFIQFTLQVKLAFLKCILSDYFYSIGMSFFILLKNHSISCIYLSYRETLIITWLLRSQKYINTSGIK